MDIKFNEIIEAVKTIKANEKQNTITSIKNPPIKEKVDLVKIAKKLASRI